MADEQASFGHVSDGDEVVIVASGELDAASSERFAEAAYQYIGTGKRLVLDLGSATFMDSSGLKVLATMAVARAGSGGVLVRNPCLQIRKLLQVAGMSHVVTVEPPLEQIVPIAS